MIKEFKPGTFFSNVVKENPCVKNAVQMSEIQQDKTEDGHKLATKK